MLPLGSSQWERQLTSYIHDHELQLYLDDFLLSAGLVPGEAAAFSLQHRRQSLLSPGQARRRVQEL